MSFLQYENMIQERSTVLENKPGLLYSLFAAGRCDITTILLRTIREI